MNPLVILGAAILLAGTLGIGSISAEQPTASTTSTSVAPVSEQVIQVNAHKFSYTPATITLKKGVPVILEFTSSDVVMGFNAPDLKAHAVIVPSVKTRVRIVPDKEGIFTFFCDIFCGDGHEDMNGTITVTA